MSKKKTLLTILAVVLVCCIAVTGTLAYLKATSNEGNAVVNTFTAAGDGEIIKKDDEDPTNGEEGFFLKESQVAKQEDSNYDYVLVDGKQVEVDSNTYEVLPKTELPKDPYIRIVGKTSVAAYLYVEVVDGLAGSGVSYTMADCWVKLDGVKGNHGGQIYVYKYNNGTADTNIVNDTTNLEQIYILKDNTLTVGETVSIDKETNPTGINLSFYGYLAQATIGTPAAAYAACFPTAAA